MPCAGVPVMPDDPRGRAVRSRIAMACEEATRFSASVRDNVLLGRPDLADDPAEAERVLQEWQAEFATLEVSLAGLPGPVVDLSPD